MEQQPLWQMDSLSLVVFVIAQDVAIGLQRLLQARLDDQRVPGSLLYRRLVSDEVCRILARSEASPAGVVLVLGSSAIPLPAVPLREVLRKSSARLPFSKLPRKNI